MKFILCDDYMIFRRNDVIQRMRVYISIRVYVSRSFLFLKATVTHKKVHFLLKKKKRDVCVLRNSSHLFNMDIQVASDSNKPIFCVECNDQEVRKKPMTDSVFRRLKPCLGFCFL